MGMRSMYFQNQKDKKIGGVALYICKNLKNKVIHNMSTAINDTI